MNRSRAAVWQRGGRDADALERWAYLTDICYTKPLN
jgi:hypothetical protein